MDERTKHRSAQSGSAKSRRRARRRRQRIARLRKLCVASAVLIVLVLATANFFPGLSLTGSDVQAPREWDEGQISRQLKKLASENKSYKKITEQMDDYPEELLRALCNNPEMLDFVLDYPHSDGSVTGGFTLMEQQREHPLILQWDKRWGYAPYGDSNIALAGCAPTCLSMVILELTGNAEATPDMVAKYAMEGGYYISGTGTDWSLMTEGCRRFGVQGEQLSLDKERVTACLTEGKPVIVSLRPGDFTTAGHFIVLTDVRDGQIVVRDPNSRARSEKLWDYETLASQIKNLWVFTALGR